MSDDADNVVLRLLREMRADMVTKGDVAQLRSEMADLRNDVSDLRHDVSEGFARVAGALTTIVRRLDDDARVAERLTAIEKRLSDLEARRGS